MSMKRWASLAFFQGHQGQGYTSHESVRMQGRKGPEQLKVASFHLSVMPMRAFPSFFSQHSRGQLRKRSYWSGKNILCIRLQKDFVLYSTCNIHQALWYTYLFIALNSPHLSLGLSVIYNRKYKKPMYLIQNGGRVPRF